MARKLRRLAECSFTEQLLLAQLAICALAVGVALRIVSLPRLARVALGPFPLFHRRHPIERVAALAGMAASLSLGQGRCLTRSLLLYWLLRARGEPALLLVGVAREAGAFEAHSWVESGGEIRGDTPEQTRRYAPLWKL